MPQLSLDRLVTGVKWFDSWLDSVLGKIENRLNVTAAPPLRVMVNDHGIHLAMSATVFVWAKSKSGGISAISGSTPGKADVTLWDFDGTSFASQGVDAEAFNVGSTAVGATKLILLAMIGKYWFVIWEDCSQ